MSTYHDTFSERDALLAALQKQTDLLNAHPEEADIISKAMNDIEEIPGPPGWSIPNADDSDSNTDMDDSDSNEDELNDHL
ncbi:hypothetical protein KXW97_004135, partial [Aspergillus fumigatus]